MNAFVAIFLIVFAGVSLAIIGVFVKAIYNAITEKRYNDSQPVLTQDVEISGKRTEVSGGKNSGVHTSYYATFEFAENKKRLELEIDDADYGLMAEGDRGKLTYQGRRYQRFERIVEGDLPER